MAFTLCLTAWTCITAIDAVEFGEYREQQVMVNATFAYAPFPLLPITSIYADFSRIMVKKLGHTPVQQKELYTTDNHSQREARCFPMLQCNQGLVQRI